MNIYACCFFIRAVQQKQPALSMCVETSGKSKTASRVYVHRNEWKVEDIKPCLCAPKRVECRRHQAVFICIETSGKSKTSSRVYVRRNEWKVEDIKPCLCASKRVKSRR